MILLIIKPRKIPISNHELSNGSMPEVARLITPDSDSYNCQLGSISDSPTIHIKSASYFGTGFFEDAKKCKAFVYPTTFFRSRLLKGAPWDLLEGGGITEVPRKHRSNRIRRVHAESICNTTISKISCYQPFLTYRGIQH